MVRSVVVRGVRIMVISGSLPVLSFGQTPQTLKMGRSFGFPDTVLWRCILSLCGEQSQKYPIPIRALWMGLLFSIEG